MNPVDIDASCVANSNECKLGDIAKSKQLLVVLCVFILHCLQQCFNVTMFSFIENEILNSYSD
jgi:hypothetical protein